MSDAVSRLGSRAAASGDGPVEGAVGAKRASGIGVIDLPIGSTLRLPPGVATLEDPAYAQRLAGLLDGTGSPSAASTTAATPSRCLVRARGPGCSAPCSPEATRASSTSSTKTSGSARGEHRRRGEAPRGTPPCHLTRRKNLVNTARVFEVPAVPYPGRAPAVEPPAGDLAATLGAARAALGDRTVWHVNSTSDGGGVAELLYAFLRRHNIAGITTRWLVADAAPEFFAITKRIYFKIYGTDRDTEPFSPQERELYARVTEEHAEGVAGFVRPGDLVVLHDPQTLGMAPHLRAAGATVVWQCHLGSLTTDVHTEQAWGFLDPWLRDPDGYVFSHPRYIPARVDPARTRVILPAIDPYSPKNRDLDAAQVRTVLDGIGLTPAPGAPDTLAAEAGREPGWIAALARVEQDVPLPPGAPVVLQVSRWDTLKDMEGVLTAFAGEMASVAGVHLVLQGPDPLAIADDPGGVEVFQRVQDQRERLPRAIRERVHLVATAGDDLEGTAFVVNALQRRASVVTQKSIREGFGLTITEGMWKHRPVVAPAVGAIPEQVIDGRTGVLVADPLDLTEFGVEVRDLLLDTERAGRLAAAGRDHCARRFLLDRQLGEYAEFFTWLCALPATADLG
ncbi:glycosyltransferase [Actinomadura sp. DC4]|uniref:glycosyltransferase n=1 Tax=Actinomadura sp. DC4 TaxID=3055069 RepID=UPI0025AF9464|nr:glycosyltransferase [Actinomadura sp. DC4]MDN3359417.1 glycosyltransferase [Actinomadura sp. DC4]